MKMLILYPPARTCGEEVDLKVLFHKLPDIVIEDKPLQTTNESIAGVMHTLHKDCLQVVYRCIYFIFPAV